jgi:hypothetical protein
MLVSDAWTRHEKVGEFGWRTTSDKHGMMRAERDSERRTTHGPPATVR